MTINNVAGRHHDLPETRGLTHAGARQRLLAEGANKLPSSGNRGIAAIAHRVPADAALIFSSDFAASVLWFELYKLIRQR